ncbi:MAG: hypothetical protein ACPGUX_09600 [Halocynthiibacter sp.]
MMIALAGSLSLTTPVVAQTLLGDSTLGERKIQLFNDGTWRFHPEEGVICVPLGQTLRSCSVTSDWYLSQPDDPWSVAVNLVSPGGFMAQLFEYPQGNLGSSHAEIVANLRRQIEWLATENGLRALVLDQSESELLGQPANTIVTQGGSHIRAFTWQISDNAIVLLQTLRLGTVFHNDHREKHQTLLNSIQLAGQE